MLIGGKGAARGLQSQGGFDKVAIRRPTRLIRLMRGKSGGVLSPRPGASRHAPTTPAPPTPPSLCQPLECSTGVTRFRSRKVRHCSFRGSALDVTPRVSFFPSSSSFLPPLNDSKENILVARTSSHIIEVFLATALTTQSPQTTSERAYFH